MTRSAATGEAAPSAPLRRSKRLLQASQEADERRREKESLTSTREKKSTTCPQLLPPSCSTVVPPLPLQQSVPPLPSIQQKVSESDNEHEASTAGAGLWSSLPSELVESILKLCTPPQLAMLSSTCKYFRLSGMIDRLAKQKLRQIQRARGIKPGKHETHVALLHYVNSQSSAAAQATAVAGGGHHTAALLVPDGDSIDKDARHALYCFGRGFHGQLGSGAFHDAKSPQSISLGFKTCQDNTDNEEEVMPAVVACGSAHTTSISRRGELFTWGLGSGGELGHGRWSPVEVNAPRQATLFQVRIVSVACGRHHTLAIAETGTLWCCGKNTNGQLGLGHLQDSMRLTMVHHLQGNRVVSAAAGAGHSLALAADGSLFTWGDGRYGQTGHSQMQSLALAAGPNQPIAITVPQKISKLDPANLAPENRLTAVAAGAYHSMALTVGGNILAFGHGEHGALGTGDTADKWKPTKVPLSLPGAEERVLRAVQLACGSGHSLAMVSNHGTLQVWTTGCNAWGQLGTGDKQHRLTFAPCSKVPHVVAVQAGEQHSIAITSEGNLFVWGRGDSGQLGLSDERSKWRPTMLKAFKVVHPDKTLRRSKRSLPFIRPVVQENKRARMSVPVM